MVDDKPKVALVVEPLCPFMLCGSRASISQCLLSGEMDGVGPVVPAQNSFTAEITASRSAQVSELSVLQAAPPIPSLVASISNGGKEAIPAQVGRLAIDVY